MLQGTACHWASLSEPHTSWPHMLYAQAPHRITFIRPVPSSSFAIITSCNSSIHPSSTLCYYITHLTSQFQSAKIMWNYISRVRFLHKQLSLTLEAINSFTITSLLHAIDITLRTPPLGCLPILPHLLHQLCLLTTRLLGHFTHFHELFMQKSFNLLPCLRAIIQSDCRISGQNHLSSFGVIECIIYTYIIILLTISAILNQKYMRQMWIKFEKLLLEIN